MEVEKYFGKKFVVRLRDLLWFYRDKIDWEICDLNDRGKIACYLTLDDSFAEDELGQIRAKCTEMTELSILPCRLKMSRDSVEFSVKCDKIKNRLMTIKTLQMLAKYN